MERGKQNVYWCNCEGKADPGMRIKSTPHMTRVDEDGICVSCGIYAFFYKPVTKKSKEVIHEKNRNGRLHHDWFGNVEDGTLF